ncbi:hypothetical protein SLE2022_185790 [Rubroshorea leprosula]
MPKPFIYIFLARFFSAEIRSLRSDFSGTTRSAGTGVVQSSASEINKPYLPLASGDLSMETGIAITSAAFSMSLDMAIMLSPSPFLALFVLFLAGSAYSMDLPLLGWKNHPFLEAISMMIMFIAVTFGCFTHITNMCLASQ